MTLHECHVNPQTPKRCHMDLRLACLVLIHLRCHCHHPSLLQQHLEFRVSDLSFLSVLLFFGRLPFALFLSSKEELFSSPFFTKYVMRAALLFGLAPPPPILLPWLLSHLSGSRTVPWPLVLRLLASAELLLYRTSLPHLIISRTI